MGATSHRITTAGHNSTVAGYHIINSSQPPKCNKGFLQEEPASISKFDKCSRWAVGSTSSIGSYAIV